MVYYGIVLAGPPGAGKTTAAVGIQEYLRLLGRNARVVNLDPANEVPRKNNSSASEKTVPTTRIAQAKSDSKDEDMHQEDQANNLPYYETVLDVCDDVVNLSQVMTQLALGPNGGLVYCLEYMEAHVDGILRLLRERLPDDAYLIFDLPGQVELYTHGNAVRNILHLISKELDIRLVAVQLIDAHYCTDAATFLSTSLLATTTMLRLELPTVSVLSKVDLLGQYGPLPLSLDYFTDCAELDRLLPFVRQGGIMNEDYGQEPKQDWKEGMVEDSYLDDPDYQRAKRRTRQSPFFRRHQKLHQVLAETVDDFGLLSFLPLDISNAESVGRVIAKVDKANGYIFSGQGSNSAQDMFQCAVQAEASTSNYEKVADIQERVSVLREDP
jgi:GPN-loop GTPase